MRNLILLGALCPVVAAATPIQLHHQARLLDASGVPLNGPVTLLVGVYADGSTPTALWSESFVATLESGAVSLTLGADTAGNPLQDSVFDGSSRYVGVSMGGVALGPRSLLASVPSAVHATNLSGGAVSATTAVVAGDLRLGADVDTCPDGTAAGTLRWDAAVNALTVCDGSAWRAVSLDGYRSCAEVKQQVPGAASGLYTVSPGVGAPLQVWCDLSGTVGRTLLMRVAGGGSDHVLNNGRGGAYPCTAADSGCKLSTADINRFIGEPGVQVFEVDPDAAGYLSFFQRAATDSLVWPTNLECSNRPSLAATVTESWILTSYQSYSAALNNTGGDVGDYASPSHFYPTPYGNQQLFFRGGVTGIRSSSQWGPAGYADGLSGNLWVY